MSKVVKRFRDIYREYDAFMFDLWGVLYEGGPVFKQGLEVLEKLSLSNKPVVLISNSPLLNEDCKNDLREYGLNETLYKAVLTAGDLCMQYIQANFKEPKKFYLIDKKYWNGWKKFNPLHESTTNIKEADAVLCLSVPSEVDLPEKVADCFDQVFEQAIQRNLKLICANPDLFALCSKKLHLRPGLLALHYQQLGGDVLSFGKPFPEIFQSGLKELNYPKRVLMTGDTEYTDIQGAARHNIDTMLIARPNQKEPLRSQATYIAENVRW